MSALKNHMRLGTMFIYLIGSLGGLLFGFDTGIISGASPLIESNFRLSIGKTSFITSSVLIGSAIGAFGIGSLANRYGRKKLLQFSAVLFLIGSALSMFAVGFVSLVLARLLLGSALIPSLLLFFGSFILPESPRYLVHRGATHTARTVLHHLRVGTSDDPDRELDQIERADRHRGTFRTLFKVGVPMMLVAAGLMFFQQFIGINAVLYFLPQIFIKEFHFTTQNSIWISVGIGVVNLLSTIVAYRIIDKFNRKSILICGSIVVAVTLGLLAGLNYCFAIATIMVPTVILIVIYIVGYDLSWGPLAWVVMNEILPYRVRGVGSAIGSATNWICDFIVSQTLLTLISLSGNNICGPFAIYAVMAVLSIFFVISKVPETRNRSLEQIEHAQLQKYYHRK